MLVERFYVFSFLLSFSKFILFAPFPEFFSLFFIEEPIFENFDRITVYYIGTFEGQENPTFTSISSFMQENQIELVPVASVGWTWIYVLCQFKKNYFNVGKFKWWWFKMKYKDLRIYFATCIVNQNCILSDANSVEFRLGFWKSLSNLNNSDELEISNKSNRLQKNVHSRKYKSK